MHTVRSGNLAIGEGHPPRIMGVLNLSEESPYDPSVFTDPAAAAAFADELIREGADIVDIGLESANKRFDVLTADEELDRLDRAIETIAATDEEAVFSIETRYAEVAARALDAGFELVNDICGCADPEMPAICAEFDAPVVKMAGPGDLERPGALETVDEIYDALAADPLPPETIIDPAFGGWSEGKTEAIDRETFERLGEFRALQRPILVSINRKNFLRNVVGRSTEDALPVSLGATALAVERGADVIRTHDVAGTRDAALIGETFSPDPVVAPDLGLRELDVRNEREMRRHLQRIQASTALAADTAPRVFELRDLDCIEESLLEHVVEHVGATIAIGNVEGIALLAATPRQLDRLSAALTDESERLESIFERIMEDR